MTQRLEFLKADNSSKEETESVGQDGGILKEKQKKTLEEER